MDKAPRSTGRAGAGVLLGAAGSVLALGLVVGLVGWLLVDGAAGLGAIVGVVLVMAVASGGTLVVHAVAGLLPSASLLVALLTYGLQLLLLLLGFLGLERSGLLDSALDRRWVGAGAIGAVLAWLVAQVLMTSRSRIPTYDQPARRHPEGGER
ncbi:MAG TPA: hypothetical protein VD814_06015 [Nocardioides sp.]|nr:hypothetical protein [Nocardioides sp.]